MKFSFVRLDHKNSQNWLNELRKMEEAFTYPLGDDTFTINHGKDYLAFFKRIGRDQVFIVTHKQEIAAIGAGVISTRHNAWYLCDMKVHPDFRGNQIPRKLFTRQFLLNYLKCQRGYALNMDDNSGKINPIRKIIENLPWTPLKNGGRILFYYEDAGPTQIALEVLKNNRPNIHFSSLRGVKDLILKSSGEPLPILHMEWGKRRDGDDIIDTTQTGKLHMWTLSDSDPMVEILKSKGVTHKASGSIFHHRMTGIDWSELRTSEL